MRRLGGHLSDAFLKRGMDKLAKSPVMPAGF